jgi:hypothetical protein
MSGQFRRRRGTGQQEAAGAGPVVHGAANLVKGFGHSLPLVDQRGLFRFDESSRIPFDYGALGGGVEPECTGGTPKRGGGLANGPRALD